MRLSLVALSLLTAILAQAEPRVFVSLAGTLLKAEISSVSGNSVTLKRVDDGQSLVVDRKTLCKEDNAYIEKWLGQNSGAEAAPPSVTKADAPPQKYRLTCQTLPSKSNRGPPDGGERVIELSYNFNISNHEVTRDLTNAKGIVITIGKNAAETSGDLVILQKQHFDVSIRAQSKMAWSTTPVRLTYSQGVGTPHGVKSYGYVLIITDPSGNILFVEASPDSGGKYSKEILAINEVPCVMDRDFKLKSSTAVPMGYISF